MKLPIEIGLEHERVIFAHCSNGRGGIIAHVKNKSQEHFPHDTMSCLAETRGSPSLDPDIAVRQFLLEQKKVDARYFIHDYTLKHGEFEIEESLAKECFETYDGKKSEAFPSNFNLVRGGR